MQSKDFFFVRTFTSLLPNVTATHREEKKQEQNMLNARRKKYIKENQMEYANKIIICMSANALSNGPREVILVSSTS